MGLRQLKIVLPESHQERALDILNDQDDLNFWQEESAQGHFVVSVLLDSGLSETIMDLSDLILALASGAAGVLAFTTGISSALIGVMVSVALLPPLTVCGLLLGAGHHAQSFSAFVLFLTNIICINFAGVVTFFIQGISPRTWWEAKKATRKAIVLWSLILIVLVIVILL